MKSEDDGFSHIGGSLDEVLKEVSRRAGLHERLEAERGRPVRDQEILKIAERSGLEI